MARYHLKETVNFPKNLGLQFFSTYSYLDFKVFLEICKFVFFFRKKSKFEGEKKPRKKFSKLKFGFFHMDGPIISNLARARDTKIFQLEIYLSRLYKCESLSQRNYGPNYSSTLNFFFISRQKTFQPEYSLCELSQGWRVSTSFF